MADPEARTARVRNLAREYVEAIYAGQQDAALLIRYELDRLEHPIGDEP